MLRELIGRFRYARLQDRKHFPLPETDFPAYGSKRRGTTPWLPPLREPGHSPDEAFADFLTHAIRDRAEWIRFNKAELTTLPPTLGDLTDLRSLELKKNAFETVPQSIGRLSRLETALLAGNRLSTIPPAIGQLKRLMVLGLSSNRLQSLPDELGEAINLRELHLGGNALESIPDSTGRLKDLVKLDLNNNALRTLPRSLQECVNLRYLYLHDNPQLGIPDNILGPPFHAALRGLARPMEPRTILTWYFAHKA